MSGRRTSDPYRERRRWWVFVPLAVLFAVTLFLAGLRTSQLALTAVAAVYLWCITRKR